MKAVCNHIDHRNKNATNLLIIIRLLNKSIKPPQVISFRQLSSCGLPIVSELQLPADYKDSFKSSFVLSQLVVSGYLYTLCVGSAI